MNVLLSGHGADRDALDAARRSVAYAKLVLLSSAPDDRALDALRANEALAGARVEVRAVDPADLLGCLRAATSALDAHARDAVRVHVAGGPNLVASALLLAAFERGVEAFWCHARGVSRLPVLLDVRLAERFGDAERAVLAALAPAGETRVADLAREGLSEAAAKGALLRLRRDGLVRADATGAVLTATGAYYRAHLARARRS